jgi:hypothetical protein
MKKTILIYMLTIGCSGLFAQMDSTHHKKNNYKEDKYKNEPRKTTREILKDDSTNTFCSMKMLNGKVMVMVDGKMTVMDKEMVMEDGTIVLTDGTVRKRDGSTLKMNEGDCLDLSGRIVQKRTIPTKEYSENIDNR